MAIGKLLNTNYIMSVFATIIDIDDFFKTKLPEMRTVNAIYKAIRLLYGTTKERLIFECSETDRVYKYTILSNDVHKVPICWFFYIPLHKRLDYYTEESPQLPYLQWQNKKPVFKNYSSALDRAGLDKIFSGIINVL